MSFGGFIAQEIARHTQPLGLILISTCRSCHELPWLHRTLGLSAHITPAFAIAGAKRAVSMSRALFGVVNQQQASLFDQMLFDTDPRFIRWCVRALLGWNGAGALGVPTIQIHGAKDHIIPLRGVKADHVVQGAGHVVNVSHPEAVNRIVDHWLRAIPSPQPIPPPAPANPWRT